jgi:hypothetical protein
LDNMSLSFPPNLVSNALNHLIDIDIILDVLFLDHLLEEGYMRYWYAMKQSLSTSYKNRTDGRLVR